MVWEELGLNIDYIGLDIQMPNEKPEGVVIHEVDPLNTVFHPASILIPA